MVIAIAKGIQLLQNSPGEGAVAKRGSIVTYNARFFLHRGDEVTPDAQSIALYGERLDTRTVDGVKLIDHSTILGKRQPIAGVEKSLYGMRAGGFREVLVGPHLGYGEVGVPDLIPPQALLRIQLWVRTVREAA